MIVVDAGVVAEVLLGTAAGRAADPHLRNASSLHMPHFAVLETASVLRGWLRSGQVSLRRAEQALENLASFPAQRWPDHLPLARAWELRDNATVYDAAYVALAEILGATLLTTDHRLARGVRPVARCPIIEIGARPPTPQAHPSSV